MRAVESDFVPLCVISRLWKVDEKFALEVVNVLANLLGHVI